MAETVLAKRKRREVDPPPEVQEEVASHTLPSSDHRYRTSPAYLSAHPVERLVKPPEPLSDSVTALTKNGSDDPSLVERVNRAWAKSFGIGPSWELFEDRSWFKESYSVSKKFTARPHAHAASPSFTEWDSLELNEAIKYLPRGVNPEDCPSITCSFGIFGTQTPTKLDCFDTLPIRQFIQGKESHIFYAGGPVWTLDWCPLTREFPGGGRRQYLAVAPLLSSSQSVTMPRPSKDNSHGCIQIWTYSRGEDGETSVICELVLCFDCGVSMELKWCPLPSHSVEVARLGYLAGTYENGSVQIFEVPVPSMNGQRSFVRLNKPGLLLYREELCFISLDWANSDVLALGCSNGCILVYSIPSTLWGGLTKDPVLICYISVHQSIVRSISWIRVPPVRGDGSFATDQNPTAITSIGYDGVVAYTDIKEQASYMINRTRDILHAVVYSSHFNAMVASDGDTVKSFATSPSMFGKGHHIIEAMGPVLSIGVSDYHPYIVIGSADGTCQTTNMAKNPRRGTVPYYAYKVFQLDYSPALQEYRMLENFLPHETGERPQARSSSAKLNVGSSSATGAWSPEVSVTCTRWNDGCGIGQVSLLASATASGLCRIDWLSGRFHGDRVPFGSVEAIRGQVVDSDEAYETEMTE